MHPLALAAKANNDDTRTFNAAMIGGPNSEGYYKAMLDELEQLESMDAWEIVPTEAAKGHTIFYSTCALKRKRFK